MKYPAPRQFTLDPVHRPLRIHSRNQLKGRPKLYRRLCFAKHVSTSAQTKNLLPDHPVRTRFAPSPTGNLHLGSIRTALFNYLLAKRTGGQFLLRIEDTDWKRTIPGAEERVARDLQWAGLHWDEGPLVGGPNGPYRQSERTKIYRDHIAVLLQSQHAYRCFCSAERLDTLNRTRHEKGLPLGYDRMCAHLSIHESEDRAHRGGPHIVRFKAPEKHPAWHDFVYGNTGKAERGSRQNLTGTAVYDDPVLIKSDGHPTYHFANVVDDHLMKITHVIRGSEWMVSTPMHLVLYSAFGWDPPQFGHVPLLVDQQNQKLSKRNFDTDISAFRDKQGIFPDVLVNFAVLLGWSHRQKSDYLPLRQLEEVFDLKFTKGSTIVLLQKLQYLQQLYARQYILEGGEQFQTMVNEVSRELQENCDANHLPAILGKRRLEDVVTIMLRADAKSYTTAAQFAQRSSSLFQPLLATRPYTALAPDVPLSTVRTVAASLLLVPNKMWTAEMHRENIRAVTPPAVTRADGNPNPDGIKVWKRELYRFLRWSLVGGASGPSLPDVMEILGKDICVERINNAIGRTHAQEQAAHCERPNVQILPAAA